MADQTASVAILLEQQQQMLKGLRAFDKAAEKLNKSLEKLEKRELDLDRKQNLKKAREQLEGLVRTSRSASTGLERFEKRARRAGKGAAEMAKSIANLRTLLLGLGLAAATRELARFIREAVKVKAVFDGVENTLRAVTDSTVEYERASSLVIDTAKRLGVQVTSLGKNYSLFLASSRDLDLTSRQLEEAFLAVSEAGRVLNLSNQRLELTFLGLSQIASKGIVTMEELRRQLGDNLPGVLPGVAKALGVTTAELNDMVRAGNLLAEEGIPAIAAAARDLAGGQVLAATQTLQANIERLATEYQLLQDRIATTNESGMKEFVAVLAEAISGSEDTEEALSHLVGEAVSLATELAKMIPVAAKLADLLGTTLFTAVDLLLKPFQLVGQSIQFVGGELAKLADLVAGGIGEISFEAIRIEAEETARAVTEINERLLEAQGKNLDEERKKAAEVADERKRIAEEMAADILATQELMAKEIGRTIESAADVEKLTAEERKKIIRALNKEAVRLEGEAAEERAAVFDHMVRESEEAARVRVEHSAEAAVQLEKLEIDLSQKISDALDAQLAKTKLTAEQRIELQKELSEEIVKLEAETADAIDDIWEEFEKEIAEGGDREEAEREASEKLIELYEEEFEKRLDLAEEFVEKAEKLEKKRVKDHKKAVDKLVKQEEEAAKRRIEAGRQVREFFEERAEDLFGDGDDSAASRQQRINDLLKEQKRLRKEVLEGSGDPLESFQRISEIGNQINNLRRGFDEMGNSVAGADFDIKKFSDGTLTDLQDLIGGDEFREAFNSLGQASQDFAKRAIADLAQAAREGVATESSVRQLLGAFNELGLVGPKAGQDILRELEQLGQPTGAEQELSKLREEVSKLEGASQAAVEPLVKIDEAVSGVAQDAGPAADGISQIGAAAGDSAEALDSTGLAVSDIANSLPTIAESLGQLAPAAQTLLEQLRTAHEEGVLESLAAELAKIAGLASGENENLESLKALLESVVEAAESDNIGKLGEAITTLSTAVGDLDTERLSEAAESLKKISDEFQDLSSDGGGIANAATALAEFIASIDDSIIPGLERLQTALGVVEESHLDLQVTIGETADVFEEAVDRMETRAEEFATNLKALFQGIREELNQLDEDMRTKLGR